MEEIGGGAAWHMGIVVCKVCERERDTNLHEHKLVQIDETRPCKVRRLKHGSHPCLRVPAPSGEQPRAEPFEADDAFGVGVVRFECGGGARERRSVERAQPVDDVEALNTSEELGEVGRIVVRAAALLRALPRHARELLLVEERTIGLVVRVLPG